MRALLPLLLVVTACETADDPEENRPPVIVAPETVPAELFATAGQPLALQVIASDADGDMLEISWDVPPTGDPEKTETMQGDLLVSDVLLPDGTAWAGQDVVATVTDGLVEVTVPFVITAE